MISLRNTVITPVALRPLLHTSDAHVRYVPRPGAYAVILNQQGDLLTIETATGTFLPGGGQDPGETLLETLLREVDEELGVVIEPIQYLLAADDCRYSPIYKQHFHIQAHYFLGTIDEQAELIPEQGAKTKWHPLKDAASVLTRGNDRWLMRLFLGTFHIQLQTNKNKSPVPQESELLQSGHQVTFNLSHSDRVVAQVRVSMELQHYRVVGLETTAVTARSVAESKAVSTPGLTAIADEVVWHLQHTFGDIPFVDPSGTLDFNP